MIKRILFVFAILAIVWAAAALNSVKPDNAYAMLCIKTGERTSGMNKICYYSCGGSTAAITVGVAEMCPITIND